MTQVVEVEGVYTSPEGLPRWTLGWDVLEWTSDYLVQPDGPTAGQPWDYTDEQVRFILWWYALDEQGRFVYRYGMLRRMKGWGKDPFAASVGGVEFLGPCRFGGWNGDSPIAVPHSAAWVQIAAVSLDQTRNTMTLFPGLFSKAAREKYGLDIGKQIIYSKGTPKRIEAVTSSPATIEGGRPTLVIKNETQHWLANNEGHKMSEVIARNLAKSRDGSARALAIANAPAPGEGSDAEADYEAYRLGAPGMLYDNREAPPVEDLTDEAALLSALKFSAGDSYWLDVKRLSDEIQDPRTSANMARRYYLNQLSAPEDLAFDVEQWRALAKPKYEVERDVVVVLGFDGSESRDHTALIGTEVETGHQWVVGYWEPQQLPNGELRIPVDEVDAAVDAAMERWDVWRLYADPFYWREWIMTWAGRYNEPGKEVVQEYNTTLYKKMAYALLTYDGAIRGGLLSHDGDPRFTAAIQNAHRHPQAFVDDNGETMWTIEKERPDSPLKIDAAVAGCLSWEARLAAMDDGALEMQNWVVR